MGDFLSMEIHRFTPAYAGKIRADAVSGKTPEVHPRIRGEDKTE